MKTETQPKLPRTETAYRVGDTITWSSGGVSTVEKSGTVIAVVPGNEDLRDVLMRLRGKVPMSRIKAQCFTQNARYLVEVPRYHRRTDESLPPDYYAPLVKVMDNKKRQRERRAA